MMALHNMLLLLLVVAGVSLLLRVLLFRTGLIHIFKKWGRSIEDCFHVYQSLKVPEFNENMQENQLYRKVSVYVNSLASIEDSDFTNLFSGKKPYDIVLEVDSNQTVHDSFLGARVTWTNEMKSERNGCRTFVLNIRKHDKRRILRPYLQHIHAVCDEIDQRRKEPKLFMNTKIDHHDSAYNHNGRWRSIPFTHPSTLETVAMDSDLKNKVRSDLETFLRSKQYYHRLGRVWKRSYLLYGPSGTGKSSFIAAMANFLCYDVYDIDLSKVSDDSDLKMLLLQTTNRSIVVVEELDRFFAEKSTAVSLSGVLNFMDGLLSSCCGEERVMVYTMCSKELADSAILRPGRIDVHINFPLCDFNAFKALANNYLGLKDHKLFPQVEEIFQNGASLSPAEVGELMIVNRNSPSRAIKSVISAGKMGRRVSDNESRKLADESGESSGVICREKVHTVREFRKLYGLLRIKSCGKSGPLDVVTSGQNNR
ncbi:hypothetical protein L1049_013033 [Liquidambar formosana]|uniref:AAA+ ATPase domain-containing protein n=1 Tax=Liquidambar formosana TaxID=63359 RepID=A0AAP0WTQ6_LIQFO